MRSFKPAVLAIAPLALALLTSPAWCKPPETKYERIGRVTVSLAGLDLNDAGDVRTVLERLDAAAYDACGGNPKLNNSYTRHPQRTLAIYEECRTHAVKRAVDQLNAPTLTRAYADAHPAHAALACN